MVSTDSRNVLIFGATGGLATSLAGDFVSRGWKVDLVSRISRSLALETCYSDFLAAGSVRVFTVANSYAEFIADRPYRTYLFTQALFEPKLLVETDAGQIEREIAVGLTDPIRLTRALLLTHPPVPTERRDFAYIGSTSAYSGFKKTAVYCAVKHGLLGFVRAMNDEYTDSETRFWLFSMGTMNTEMGALLVDQEPASFLQPEDVARRIVDSLTAPTNLFEPELVMRRRKIRFKAQ
jgi:NAD(P)-dependent dehydrogenase (short-subunit alcohol dehydrogenase family)